MVTRLILAVVLVSLAVPANAGFDEGQTAFDRGDFAAALKEWRPLAEQGDARAQNELGKMYWEGQGTSRDEVEAVKWWRKAAHQGYARAQYNLGLAFKNGRGVTKDLAEAVKWYRRAADQGRPLAQYNLGFMYAEGEGVAKDEAEAVKWWIKAADQGYALAQYNLGIAYGFGRGVARDETEAVKWYRKAAIQGDRNAQYNLAVMYAQGRGLSKDEAEAARWYGRAAERGNAEAQVSLGIVYYYGRGVRQDYSEARKWFDVAASQGNAQAEFSLGLMHENGDGVEKSEEEAASWYRKAAKQGHPEAKRLLRTMATEGRIRGAALGAGERAPKDGRCPSDANALILSGGGIKGAYQAGAIWYLVNVLECDFSHFYGTSTGAVTAAFLSQARNHDELKALTNDLVKQYKEMKPSDIADEHFLGKIRVFMPAWLGGTDGINTLKPLAARLARQIDPKRINELTVVSVSLQTGRMRLTVSENEAIAPLETVEPESVIDFVLGSASIPVVVEPRKVRFWVQGEIDREGEDTVLMTSRNYGMPDPNCMIRANKRIEVPCVYVKTEVHVAGNTNVQWITMLRIPDPADREKLWAEAFQKIDADTPASKPERSLHYIFENGKWTKAKPVVIEFTTLHQLVDGGVTDFLFVNDLARMREDGIAATAFILTTGEYAQQPINNREYRGGVSIGKISLDHFLESHQFANLESELRSAAYTGAIAETLDWADHVLRWRREMMTSEVGRAELAKLESGLANRFPERAPRVSMASKGSPYPRTFLLMPELRIFEDVFDARPEAINEALAYGCRLAAGVLDSREIAPDVYRATPAMLAPRCEELLQ